MGFAKNENIFATPESAGLGAKSGFLAPQLNFGRGKTDVALLIFDSALQPLIKGVRGSAAVRQMLFKAGSIFIDMQIQPTPGSDSRVLIGQLHDSVNPDHGIGGVPVSLFLEGGAVSRNETNQAGEFDFGIHALGKLHLVFGIGENRTLMVAVPDGDSLGYS
jgi:hypothetical protein